MLTNRVAVFILTFCCTIYFLVPADAYAADKISKNVPQGWSSPEIKLPEQDKSGDSWFSENKWYLLLAVVVIGGAAAAASSGGGGDGKDSGSDETVGFSW